jgi:hypothetical protein
MPLWNRFLAGKFLSLLLLMSAVSAQSQIKKKLPIASCRNRIFQGVSGQFFEAFGNQMPAPGKGAAMRKGVQREFGIFLPATLSNATRVAGEECFFKKTGSKLIKKAISGRDGCFSLALLPGKYSIFTREKGRWYANSFGGDGEIFQFEVFPDSVTHIDFRINHGAWY